MKQLLKYQIALFISLGLIFSANAVTTTWTGGTGDWNTGGNWDTGNVPTSADNVVIDGASQTITLSAAGACNDLTITCYGNGPKTITVNVGANILTVHGTATLDGTAASDAAKLDAGSGGVIFKGIVNLGTASNGSGSAILDADGTNPGYVKFEAAVNLGAAARTLPGTEPDMILDATGTQTVTRSSASYYFMAESWIIGSTNTPTVTFTGTSSEQVDTYDGDLTVAANATLKIDKGGCLERWIAGGGTLTLNSGSVLDINADDFIGHNNTNGTDPFNTYTLNSGSTVKYTGATQTVRHEYTYGSLTISGSGTATASGTLDINNDLTLSSTFDAGTNTIKIADDMTVTGAFLTASTSTFEFDGGGASSITRTTALTFNNLTSSGATTLTMGDVTTVGGTLTLNGTSKIDLNAVMDLNAVDINSGTELLGGLLTHTVSGNWADDGTFTEEGGTITFDGTTDQTISGGSANFNNAIHSGTAKLVLGGAITVNNDLTTNSGAGAFESGASGGGGPYTVGTGTTSTPSRSPFAGLYEDTRKQYIITAAELTTAGMSANDIISSVAWEIKTKSSAAGFTFDNFTVKLGHTSTSTFPNTTWLTPTFTTCYAGSPTTTTGWNTISFSSNFTWNGTDNIVVQTCFDIANGGADADDAVYYTSTSSTVIWAYSNSESGCTMEVNKFVSAYRPNIRFGTVPASGYDVTLKGDFDNNTTYTHKDNKFIFSGSSAQAIKGSTAASFYKFNINNTSGVTITKGPTVENVIDFEAGDITAADLNNKFTLGASATINSSFPADAASHVVGYCQVSTTSTSEREIPVGDGTLYRPAYITPESTSAERYFSKYDTDAHTSAGTKHTDVNKVSDAEWWEVGRVGDNSVNCKIKLTWDANSGVQESSISDLAIGHWEDQGSGIKWYREGTAWTTDVTNDWIVTDAYVDNFSPFTLISKSSGALLPIDLLDFTAYEVDANVKIEWTTATETNNDYFTVEKSKTKTDFEGFAEVPGAGNSTEVLNYSVFDFSPYSEGTYYRLKQTDFDGAFTYSNIIHINVQQSGAIATDIDVYPNPVKPGQSIKISMDGFDESKEVLVILQDVLGRTVHSKVLITSLDGGATLALNSTEDLSPGIYLITGASKNHLFSKRLVVE